MERKQIYEWREIEGPPEAKYKCESEMAEASTEFRPFQEHQKLKATLTEEVMELDCFPKCLPQSRRGHQEQQRIWPPGVYAEFRRRVRQQGGLTVEWMCQASGVHRAGYYRELVEKAPDDEAMPVVRPFRRWCLSITGDMGTGA